MRTGTYVELRQKDAEMSHDKGCKVSTKITVDFTHLILTSEKKGLFTLNSPNTLSEKDIGENNFIKQLLH